MTRPSARNVIHDAAMKVLTKRGYHASSVQLANAYHVENWIGALQQMAVEKAAANA